MRLRAEAPCEPTWLNYTGRHLIAGGTTHPGTLTSDECAALCAYNMSDCVAVQFYYSGSCVVHKNAAELDAMEPHATADVYVIIRCNTTGTRRSVKGKR